MSIVFIAGVHGVGKGYIGIPVAEALGVSHFTASQLIQEEKGRATWGIDKKVSDLGDNQLALLRAIAQKRLAFNKILLDGHFVMRNEMGTLTPIEVLVFSELKLSGVILLTEKPAIVADRVTKRDGVATTASEISEFAEAESVHAHKVCLELALPLEAIHAPTEKSVAEAVKRMLQA